MNVVVTIEKAENGFIAYCDMDVMLIDEDKNLERVKLKLERQIYKYISKDNVKIDIEYRYNAKKLLNDVRPFISSVKLSEYSGLTPVSMCYYKSGTRNITEKNFLRLIEGVRTIAKELYLLSN
ncbi:hypothetical protein DF185_09330 [Marinifilum breve]|uniref:Uncharacterized protein n=1 Tax=Marinifilum breve TaxID=2184082 RepID=A0A2V3ZYX5_9BACT|nr:hypothetical protein [Marinifilum breve]PXY01659.1 hypothetical protein DF185_09330 [Marinifilum breve]